MDFEIVLSFLSLTIEQGITLTFEGYEWFGNDILERCCMFQVAYFFLRLKNTKENGYSSGTTKKHKLFASTHVTKTTIN